MIHAQVIRPQDFRRFKALARHRRGEPVPHLRRHAVDGGADRPRALQGGACVQVAPRQRRAAVVRVGLARHVRRRVPRAPEMTSCTRP
ncbi:MAG: hypothetical protein M0C28_23245 [Candidatus Moduliflexus flocculans]|nr:hypothetical protein [Candidatus Moduliflexus flocculans]